MGLDIHITHSKEKLEYPKKQVQPYTKLYVAKRGIPEESMGDFLELVTTVAASAIAGMAAEYDLVDDFPGLTDEGYELIVKMRGED